MRLLQAHVKLFLVLVPVLHKPVLADYKRLKKPVQPQMLQFKLHEPKRQADSKLLAQPVWRAQMLLLKLV